MDKPIWKLVGSESTAHKASSSPLKLFLPIAMVYEWDDMIDGLLMLWFKRETQNLQGLHILRVGLFPAETLVKKNPRPPAQQGSVFVTRPTDN